MRHETTDVEREGYPAIRLTSPYGLAATYVPATGMLCCSLTHDGDELLGQRDGIDAYVQDGATMGIPLLHPWANRLGGPGYDAAGMHVDVPAGAPGVHLDGATGLPIHGLVAGCSGWDVTNRDAGERAHIEARLDAIRFEYLMALFPFPHELQMSVELLGNTLSITTTLLATGDRAVPVAFGYHPYFRLPGVARSDWTIELPVTRRSLLDDRCLPTGETEAVAIAPGPLGDRTYDDLFVEMAANPVFSLSGGGRTISVAFRQGYPVSVVYSPSNDDVICYEPMTATTDPFSHLEYVQWVEPGSKYVASFDVMVD
jgi:galactose mutarotase-like enzyme